MPADLGGGAAGIRVLEVDSGSIRLHVGLCLCCVTGRLPNRQLVGLLIMDWQPYAVLGVVLLTLFLMARGWRKSRLRKSCGQGCDCPVAKPNSGGIPQEKRHS